MKKIFILLGFCAAIYGCSSSHTTKETGAMVVNTQEPHRPLFHFTPPAKWMNDPNGMVYHNGEYHLFYQHYPEGNTWGPMHWGHAVSKDLVSWEHLPIALYPDSLGMIFSGSAVVDHSNTSGLGTPENPAMVAIFTYHDAEGEKAGSIDYQTQGIAYSLDNGRTWTKYENNPVLKNPGIKDFRDPKVMWYEEGKKWVMTLAVADHIRFYSSPNLIDWKEESQFGANVGAHGGVWECPDLFKLPIKNSNQEKWVLLVSINPGAPNGGSGTQYFIGHFDGSNFVPDQQFMAGLRDHSYIPEGKVIANFEKGTYEGWRIEGSAFGKAPAKGALAGQQQVANMQGRGFVNSFYNGDASTGKLTSPKFTISNNFIHFLVGGGKHPDKTMVNLLVDGKVVHSTTGNNSESLSWITWDTKSFKSREATIEIIDSATGGWGHILADHFIQSDVASALKGEEGIWIDYGRDNYAGVTWSNVPQQDGRRLFMGWMSNWAYANEVPTENWRNAMTIPRTLILENTTAGIRIVSDPVKELSKLTGTMHTVPSQMITDTLTINNLPAGTSAFKIELELEMLSPESSFYVELSNSRDQKMLIGYDAQLKQYFTDRRHAGNTSFSKAFAGIHYAPRLVADKVLHLQLWVDVASVELFADGGKTTMTDIFFPDEPFNTIRVVPLKESVKVNKGVVSELKPAFAKAL